MYVAARDFTPAYVVKSHVFSEPLYNKRGVIGAKLWWLLL